MRTRKYKEHKVILEFPILYQGWELDDKGWVMEREDGSRYLLTTNHGSHYLGDPERLRDKIKEYEEAIELTEEALQLAGGDDED